MWYLKKYKAIAYLPTVYTLLQYYLLEPCKMEETLFLIDSTFPAKIVQRMLETIKTDFSFLYNSRTSALKIRIYSFLNPKTPVYLGSDLLCTNLFLRYMTEVYYLEDGVGSYELVYQKEKQVIQRNESMLRRWLYGDLYPWHGLADNVKKIYLTGILPIPEIIANKVELIDLQSLWQQKNAQQKENILKLFLPEDFDKNLLTNYEILLLTQPFSEDSFGSFSELDKIEVYRKLLSSYDESKVLIKVHPRETTDYSYYFPKIRILQTACPMELLMLLGFSVKKAISINSTAIFNLGSSVEKIISGYDVTPALEKEAKRRGIYEGISNKQK